MWARLIWSEGGHREPRGLLDFLWAYWLCFQNNELRVAAYMCVIVLLSFHLYVACKSRSDFNKVSKYSQKLSGISSWPVSLLTSPSFPAVEIYQYKSVYLLRNPPFLPTSRRRGMCTVPCIDSNAEEGNILKYIHGVYRAISARDHTILPRRSDKIRYFSYFHVFSIHFLILGKGGRRVWPEARLISI